MTKLGVYLHVPFCVQKCHYCDFLSAPATRDTMETYCKVLCREIAQESEKYQDREVDTVFFGGGTPSIVPVDCIEACMDELRRHFRMHEGAEITMECNPGTVSKEGLFRYHKAGINRISFGLQSTDNEDLRRLGRIHTYETFLESFAAAREAGFKNISVDLMASLPGQTVSKFQTILEKVLALEPEHLSVYSLMIEEGTRFYQWFEEENGKGMPPLPEEEEDRRIYEMTKKVLLQHGMHRYEISNYAKPGCESQHNVKYWDRSHYLGLGLGASSMVDDVRWHRTSDLQQYCQGDFERLEEEHLTLEECMGEFMFLGLRMMRGVSREVFFQQFGQDMETVYGAVISKHIEEGLLEEYDGGIRLTDRGIDVSNYVMSDFV